MVSALEARLMASCEEEVVEIGELVSFFGSVMFSLSNTIYRYRKALMVLVRTTRKG